MRTDLLITESVMVRSVAMTIPWLLCGLLLTIELGCTGSLSSPPKRELQTPQGTMRGGTPITAQLQAIKAEVQALKRRLSALETRLHSELGIDHLRGTYQLVHTLGDVNALTTANLQGHYVLNRQATSQMGLNSSAEDTLDIFSLFVEDQETLGAVLQVDEAQIAVFLNLLGPNTIQLERMVPPGGPMTAQRLQATLSHGGNRLTLINLNGRRKVYDRTPSRPDRLVLVIDAQQVAFTATFFDGRTETVTYTLAAITGPMLLLITQDIMDGMAYENLATLVVLDQREDGRLTLFDTDNLIGTFFGNRFQSSRFRFARHG